MHMKHLSESLLDSFDDIVNRAEKSIYLEKFYSDWENSSSQANNKKFLDCLGRKLKKGDLVLVADGSGFIHPGKIIDINKSLSTYKCMAVSYKGDGSDITILAGPKKGQINPDEYYSSADLLKIDENILKMIYHIK